MSPAETKQYEMKDVCKWIKMKVKLTTQWLILFFLPSGSASCRSSLPIYPTMLQALALGLLEFSQVKEGFILWQPKCTSPQDIS